MLLILFGTPGVGKSYIGNLLSAQYQFHFYEADTDLTPAMVQAVQKQEIYTDAMRDEYFAIVIERLKKLKQIHSRLVMAQALAKERNRQQILSVFPEARFTLICTAPAIIEKRLAARNDWVTLDYANRISQIFEKPQIPHHIIDNNDDIAHLKLQLNELIR